MAREPRRYILHADLDAFYASVEQRANPALEGRPVVVGGPPESRGVVAAASYEAREYGIHSAMPMRTAVRLCPSLVRVSPRFGVYRDVSRRIMGFFRELTPLVEPLSLDEAYLDVSQELAPQAVGEAAGRLKARVKEETGLAVTIGGGTTKTVAKIASQVAKPDGLLLVPPGDEAAFLGPLDVGMLWGVGPKTASVLREHGVATIGNLARCDEGWLARTLGKRGPELRARTLGEHTDPVTPHRETKSVSAETTLAEDEDREPVLREEMERLSRGVGDRLQGRGLKGRTVQVKLRLADFTTFTRQTTLPEPTDHGDIISRVAWEICRREMGPGRRFRLLGVGVSGFSDVFQLSLLPLD